MMRKILAFLSSAIVLGACGTSQVYIDSVRPAEIMVPEHINRIAVANRSVAGKGSKLGNVVEGLFSGEGIGADRKGSEACVVGMVDATNSLGLRLTAVEATEAGLTGTGRDEMLAPIRWSKVDSICSFYNADALLLLESFDSDSRTSVGNPIKRTKTINKRKVNYFEYPAELFMNVHAGWRIYDAKNHRIVDQNTYDDSKSFSARGQTADQAQANLPSKTRALKDAGYYAGERYAYRVNPTPLKLSRTYYTKAKKEEAFKQAKQLVKANDWNAAVAIWKEYTEHENSKVAGRACYNMAIASEVLGAYRIADEWAEKAIKLGVKQALNYRNALSKRLKDEALAEEQLYEKAE